MAIKEHRGGKYDRISLDTRSILGTLGFTPNEYGIKREFVGSGTKEYEFYSETKGILTVRANSYEEAWKTAKLMGYKRRRYKG